MASISAFSGPQDFNAHESAGSSHENWVPQTRSHLPTSLISSPFYSKKKVGTLGFGHYAGPCHLAGKTQAVSWSARGPSLNAATKSPVKKQALPTSDPPPLLKGQTGLLLLFLFSLSFSSLPLSPFLFLMPFPSPSKIPHISSTCKVCPRLTHHGLSHVALTHQGPNSWKRKKRMGDILEVIHSSYKLKGSPQHHHLYHHHPPPPPPTTATPPYHPTNTTTPPSPATDTLGFEIPDQPWSVPSL